MTLSMPGELAALLTAVCWSGSGLAFEDAGRRIGSLSVNIIRLAMALVFFMVLGFFSRGLVFPTDASHDAWIWLSLSGIVGFTIGDMCLFRALVLLGARLALLVMALVPLLTALLGWAFLGEVLSTVDYLGMILIIFGVVWVLLERKGHGDAEPQRTSIKGVLLGLISAISQAVGLVLSKRGMGSYDPFAATQIRVIAGFLGFALVFVFIGWWPKVIASFQNRRALLSTGIGALVGPFLGVSLALTAIQRTQTGVAATIMALVPVIVIPLSVIIKKEKVSIRSVLGALVAVLGTAILFLVR